MNETVTESELSTVMAWRGRPPLKGDGGGC